MKDKRNKNISIYTSVGRYMNMKIIQDKNIKKKGIGKRLIKENLKQCKL